jgi:mRNA-degrading endonuclease RelE of RelBE toxin-antitoxin system
MYRVTIRKGAQKTIARQSRPVREQMIKEIDQLEADPDDPALHVERLVGGSEWRLRFKGRLIGFARSSFAMMSQRPSTSAP